MYKCRRRVRWDSNRWKDAGRFLLLIPVAILFLMPIAHEVKIAAPREEIRRERERRCVQKHARKLSPACECLGGSTLRKMTWTKRSASFFSRLSRKFTARMRAYEQIMHDVEGSARRRIHQR